jgi:hypothetical protein
MKLHTGKILTETELAEALKKVANDLRENAYAIHSENAYASHVTQEEKERYLQERLGYANEVEKGLHNRNFTIWQRVDTMLTGECVAFLP